MRGTVVITASAGSFPGLAERLREDGFAVETRPLLRFAPPHDWAAVDAALDRVCRPAGLLGSSALPGYADVAFTSPRAVLAVAERLRRRGLAWPSATSPSPRSALRPGASSLPAVWSAGEGTSRAIHEALGQVGEVRTPVAADVGRQGAAAALAAAMIAAEVRGPVFFPCGDRRRDELPTRLRAQGMPVDDVVCYRAVLAGASEMSAAAAAAAVLVVASPTVARALAEGCPPPGRPALVAVGPVTAAAGEAAGWRPAAVAGAPTPEVIGAAVRSLLGHGDDTERSPT